MISFFTHVSHVFMREYVLQLRQKNHLVNAILLFVMMMVFFPLTLPADMSILNQIFPGLLWMTLLFFFFMSADHLFYLEIEYGVVEQWLLTPFELHWRIRIKLFFAWLSQLCLLIFLIPFLSLFFHFSFEVCLELILVLTLSTPALFYLCAFAASFAIGVRQKGLFMILIVLPLSLPVMILGSACVNSVIQQAPFSMALALLSALSLLVIFFMPWAISSALKISIT